MPETWIISDTHFCHAEILDTGQGEKNFRSFDDVHQMNQCIMDNWNDTVSPGDTVYHLGDVFVGDNDWFIDNFAKLSNNINVHLILGNRDDPEFMISTGFFDSISIWIKSHERKLIMSHAPLSRMVFSNKPGKPDKMNVHGHIHVKKSPKGNYFNACVENHDYCPVNIDSIW